MSSQQFLKFKRLVWLLRAGKKALTIVLLWAKNTWIFVIGLVEKSKINFVEIPSTLLLHACCSHHADC
jgi:hypothetical protein